jgi:hypothetical protein
LDNPYDMAQAVTGWLRNNIDYDRQTAAPPPGQDPVDWFLFDSRVGFCNYYASAEILLLRSLGIPARMAVGYASGTALPGGAYEVHADDAHAWPEVFFPGIGWVEFEPTVSQPALIRPQATEVTREELSSVQEFNPSTGALDRDTPVVVPGQSLDSPRFLIWLGFVLVCMAVGILVLRANPRLVAQASSALIVGLKRVGVRPPRLLERAQRAASLSPVSQIYAGWTSWLDRLGPRLTRDQTPFERASIFADRFPVYREAGWAIAEGYAAERYGHADVDPAPIRSIWRDLLPRLRRAWLRHWLQESPWVHRVRPWARGSEDSRAFTGGADPFEA